MALRLPMRASETLMRRYYWAAGGVPAQPDPAAQH